MQATKLAQRAYSDAQEQARRRRNRNITVMLISVIVLFIVCNIGEVFMSCLELYHQVKKSRDKFDNSTVIKNIISINHLLHVINSSINFVIYCLVGEDFKGELLKICLPRRKASFNFWTMDTK